MCAALSLVEIYFLSKALAVKLHFAKPIIQVQLALIASSRGTLNAKLQQH